MRLKVSSHVKYYIRQAHQHIAFEFHLIIQVDDQCVIWAVPRNANTSHKLSSPYLGFFKTKRIDRIGNCDGAFLMRQNRSSSANAINLPLLELQQRG